MNRSAGTETGLKIHAHQNASVAGALFFGVTDKNHSRSLQISRLLGSLYEEVIEVPWETDSGLDYRLFESKRYFHTLTKALFIGSTNFAKAIFSTPRQCKVILAHPSQLNLLIALPLTKLLRRELVIDFYVSLHDTLVGDRKLINPISWLAKLLHRIDRFSLHAADKVIFETQSNLERFCNGNSSLLSKSVILLPSPPAIFNADGPTNLKPERDVVFIGKLAPVMGVESVLEAISSEAMSGYKFTFVGSGQSSSAIASRHRRDNISFIDHMPFDEVPALIQNHRLSLGSFGDSQKTHSVFSNKVMESLRLGVPCLTSYGEISKHHESIGCFFVEPSDTAAIISALQSLLASPKELAELARQARAFSSGIGSDDAISRQTREMLSGLVPE